MKKNHSFFCGPHASCCPLLLLLLLGCLICQASSSPTVDLSSVDNIVAHLQEEEELEPEETLKLLQTIKVKSSSGDKAVDGELASLASQLLDLAATANDSNCTLKYFNHLGRLNSRSRDYPSISRVIDRLRSSQLALCHQRNPRFSAYLAMNAAPHYLNF